MTSFDFEGMVNKCYQFKQEGKEYSEIRKYLKELNIDEPEIKKIIRDVDDKVLAEAVGNSERGRTRELIIIGYILLIGGGLLTIGNYFGYINVGNVYIVAYGPVIAGYFLIKSAKMRAKRRDRIKTF